MNNNPLCKMEYWVGTKFVETTIVSAPKFVCMSKKKILSNTTHKLGIFKIIPFNKMRHN
jgi:hypothetical protein